MYIGFSRTNNDITEGVADRYYSVVILNPVRLNAKAPAVVHDKLIGMMPDVAQAIADTERFYATRPGRYHNEHTIYKRNIPSKGYDVYTIVLDEDRQYDSQILSSAIAKICDQAGASTKYRLVKDSDVVDSGVWAWTRAILRTSLRASDTMELYEGAVNTSTQNCDKCMHNAVCKHLAMGAARPQCEHFYTLD